MLQASVALFFVFPLHFLASYKRKAYLCSMVI